MCRVGHICSECSFISIIKFVEIREFLPKRIVYVSAIIMHTEQPRSGTLFMPYSLTVLTHSPTTDSGDFGPSAIDPCLSLITVQ